uniref:heavy-metal-associated domain-containing protein n=1 Tax=Sandarakinorhabdus rubra TaxID=2672568 RepID=UPI0013DA320C
DRSGGGGSAYAVGGIAVDVTARSVDEARRTAWRAAERRAWPQLWARLTGRAEADAPRLSDAQIDAMVAGIESQGERFSANRYIARLGVVFDRSRTAERLGGSLALLQSPPMLLLPLLVDGGATTLTQAPTAWRDAWARYRGNVTPIDYVLPAGTPGDNLWLNGWQARRRDHEGWRTIMARFDTVDVLVAEVQLTRRFPGGPIRGLFIVRHGPDGTELGRFALSVRSEDALPGLMDEGVRRSDALYAGALRAGLLRAEPDLAVDLAPLAEDVTLIGAAPEPEATDLPAAPPAGSPARPLPADPLQ